MEYPLPAMTRPTTLRCYRVWCAEPGTALLAECFKALQWLAVGGIFMALDLGTWDSTLEGY
jgi:hypothetical protein